MQTRKNKTVRTKKELSLIRREAGSKGGKRSTSRPFRDKQGLASQAVRERWELYREQKAREAAEAEAAEATAAAEATETTQ